MIKIAILDDHANAALALADWSPVEGVAELQVFNRALLDAEIVTALKPFEVICTLRERVRLTREILDQLPALKAIVVTDAHVHTIDYAAAEARGIKILEAKAPQHLSMAPSATAEFVWGLILATVRHIPSEAARLRAGEWQHTLGIVLAGKVIGLVGLGKIGALIARYAQAFDMHVIAWSQNLTDEASVRVGARKVEKERLFREADVVSIHYVLSERSRGLVGAPELGVMKRSAYLINTSRGPIVDEVALLDALTSKKIAGAGLDVFDREPLPREHPFRTLQNVTATPHLGFVTEPAMRRFYVGTASTVAAYVRGETLPVLLAKNLSYRAF